VLAGKRLELLKEAVTKISRVAALWNPHDPSSAQQWKESQLAARELGLQLHSMEVSSADRFESAFNSLLETLQAAPISLGNLLLRFAKTRNLFTQKSILSSRFFLTILGRAPMLRSSGSFCGAAHEV
jgi:ABC-type uncharacterized transport system substrate-binding protein